MAIVVLEDLPASLQSAEMIDLMIAGANARAARVAPCLVATGDDAPSQEQVDEAKLVIVGAIRRWVDAGAGALQSQSAGPFSQTVDTRQRTGYNLWPSEIEALQAICSAGTEASTGAFSITPGRSGSAHLPWCSLMLGATFCSCGADLTDGAYPLYEGGVLTTGDEY